MSLTNGPENTGCSHSSCWGPSPSPVTYTFFLPIVKPFRRQGPLFPVKKTVPICALISNAQFQYSSHSSMHWSLWAAPDRAAITPHSP